jgi:hypothetical protein
MIRLHGGIKARESETALQCFFYAGEYVMTVRPRSAKLPVAPSLTAFVEGKNGQILRETLDFEISFGRWDSGDSNGRIELSTLPWKQGTTISISGD